MLILSIFKLIRCELALVYENFFIRQINLESEKEVHFNHHTDFKVTTHQLFKHLAQGLVLEPKFNCIYVNLHNQNVSFVFSKKQSGINFPFYEYI